MVLILGVIREFRDITLFGIDGLNVYWINLHQIQHRNKIRHLHQWFNRFFFSDIKKRVCPSVTPSFNLKLLILNVYISLILLHVIRF